jgi:hypothetical protein
MSPFIVPHSVYGTHAARLESVIKLHGITGANALDLGSHPGACASSLLKIVKKITCVSLQDDDEMSPYVFRDGRAEFISADADEFTPTIKYDIIHDDIDVSGDRNRLTEHVLAINAIKRSRRLRKFANWYVFTIRDVNPEILLALYDAYKDFGFFDIVKPQFSNPWRVEFVVILRNVGGDRKKRYQFLESMYSFLDRASVGIYQWSATMSEKISQFREKEIVPVCPYRVDHDYQRRLEVEHTLGITRPRLKLSQSMNVVLDPD